MHFGRFCPDRTALQPASTAWSNVARRRILVIHVFALLDADKCRDDNNGQVGEYEANADDAGQVGFLGCIGDQSGNDFGDAHEVRSFV